MLTWDLLDASGDIPHPRQNHTCSYVDCLNSIVMFGGMGAVTPDNDVYVLNVSTMEWNRQHVINEGPCARYQHSATVYENKIIIAG